MPSHESDLARAERHVAAAERHVARMEALVARVAQRGPSDVLNSGHSLLTTLRTTLELAQGQLAYYQQQERPSTAAKTCDPS